MSEAAGSVPAEVGAKDQGGGETVESTTIVSPADIWIGVKFFFALITQLVVDGLLLVIALAVLIGVDWASEYPKEWFPHQVKIIGGGEIVLDVAVGICAAWYVVLDVAKILRRTTEVMKAKRVL